jgi:hypothetical protein
MDDDLADFWVHTATVETLTGSGAYGDQFAEMVLLSPDNTTPNGCFIDGKRSLVRNANGEQVVSSTTLYTPIANAGLFTPDSRVTTGGVVSRVITVNANDSGSLGLPDHVAVSLT